MEIQIVKITNGWMVTTRTPKGVQSMYVEGWQGVLTYLTTFNIPLILKGLESKIELEDPNQDN